MRRSLFGHKKSRRTARAALVLLTLVCLAVWGFRLADRALMPAALTLASGSLSAVTNRAYQEALEEVVTARGLVSSDFYAKSVDESGRLTDLSVNTLLVNAVCADLAARVSASLSARDALAVQVPLGALFGIDLLANAGPRVTVRLLHAGGAEVTYASAFESAGINRVHFTIWLTITSEIRTANPARGGVLTMTRDVPLVSTVFAGEIPAVYLAPQ